MRSKSFLTIAVAFACPILAIGLLLCTAGDKVTFNAVFWPVVGLGIGIGATVLLSLPSDLFDETIWLEERIASVVFYVVLCSPIVWIAWVLLAGARDQR